MYLVPALGIRIQISLLKVFDVKKTSVQAIVQHWFPGGTSTCFDRTLAYDRQTDTRP